MQERFWNTGSLSEDLYIRLVLDGKRIVGANILDNYRVSGIVKNYMLRLFAGETVCSAGLSAGYAGKSGTFRSFYR